MIIKQDIYDGALLHKRFAYRYFKDKVQPTGNIVAFRAKAEVTTNLIDLEDVIKQDFIYSDDMVHFCWEIPIVDFFGGVCFQRLFNTYIGDILSNTIQKAIELRGDDIYLAEPSENAHGIIIPQGKTSVSITHMCNGAMLGHTGINVKAGIKAPAHAASTNMTEQQVHQLMQDVIGTFYATVNSIFIATTKII